MTVPRLAVESRTDLRGGFNPSCVVWRDELLVSVRQETRPQPTPFSRVVLGRIDHGWQMTRDRLAHAVDAGPFGHEDLRLFAMGDRLRGISTTGQGLAVVDFDDAGDMTAAHLIPGSSGKNWSPVADGSGRFLFSPTGPVLTYAGGRMSPDPPSAYDGGGLRGGSQLIPYNGGYIAVAHEHGSLDAPARHAANPAGRRAQIRRGGGRRYLHRFVRYSPELVVERVSTPFVFEGAAIEFCAGLARWRDRFVVSYGVADREARLAVVDEATVRAHIEAP